MQLTLMKKEGYIQILYRLGISMFLSMLSFHTIWSQTQTVSSNLHFSNHFSNVNLDPNGKIGAQSRSSFVRSYADKSLSPGLSLNDAIKLMGGDVSIPGWLTGIGGFFCSDYSVYMNINGSIDVGAYYEINSIGRSNIDITYPVRVHITYPAANTFACGDIIRIYTNYENPQPTQANMAVTPPFLNQEIGPIVRNLKFGASIGISAWAGIGIDIGEIEECERIHSFNNSVNFPGINIPLPGLPPFLNICNSAFGPGANNATVMSCAWSPATPLLNLAQQQLDDYNESRHTNFTIFDFPDHNTVHMAPPDLPAGPTLPEFEGTFKNTTNAGLIYNLFSDVNGVYTMKVDGTKSSMSQLSLDLISLIDFTGVPTSKSLGGGLGSIDIGDASPTITVDQNFKFLYTPVVHLQIDLGISMAYSVFNANNTLSHTGNGQYVNLIAGQYIAATVPQGQTTPVNAGGQSTMDGTFKSLLDQDYYRSLKLAFGQLELKHVFKHTLWEDEVLKDIFDTKTILNHSFNLALPNALALPSFTIDPENPVIDIPTLAVQDVRNIGGGEREVVYKLTVQNKGDVDLHDVQVDINLAAAYATSKGYSVQCIYSNDFTVNNGFTGGTNKHLLAPNNTLVVDQTKSIEFVVKIKPAVSSINALGCFSTVEYTIAAKAFGTSPIGTQIESDYNQCTMMTTGQDITATVNLGAEIISSLSDFTIYGWKGVVFDKNFSKSFGHVGSAGDMVFENVSLQGGPAVEIIGDIYSKGGLNLLGESKVIVDYVQNRFSPQIANFKSGLFPTGVISNNSNCVSTISPISLNKPQNTSLVKINIPDNGFVNLAPGSYNEVILGVNSSATFSPGTYNINTWRFLGNNAQIKYNTSGNKINIHVDKFEPLQREGLQMIVTGGGNVNDVMINVYGNQPAIFSNSIVQGIIMAPKSEVEFNTNSRLEGACYADKVNFKTGSTFKGTKYTIPLNVNSICGNHSLQNDDNIALETRESKAIASIKTYPNPVTNKIFIEGLPTEKEHFVHLYDLHGRLILFSKWSSTSKSLDVQNLQAGIYILKVDKTDFNQRIVKL